MSFFSEEFLKWLDKNADAIDQASGGPADELLQRIAREGVFAYGIDQELGGLGDDKTQVVEVLAELAEHSLTAAFISWGHRTLIENIADHAYLREHYLTDLLAGNIAGGTALSNAVKFLSSLEELNVHIIEEEGKYYLKGHLPWVTNLRSDKFLVIFVADFQDKDEEPLVIAIPSTAPGLTRSADLEFVSLQGSNTASLTFERVELNPEWIISRSAKEYLAETRPTFLGYQFGLAFGLAQRSLQEVEKSLHFNASRLVLQIELEDQLEALETIKKDLYQGLKELSYFIKHPKELFQLRIDIVDVVAQSLLLELQASGGRGYFSHSTSSFIRRWNEGAFLPIVSPSAVQLRLILENS